MADPDLEESADEQEHPDYREEARRRARAGESVNVEAYFAASLGPPRWAERLQDLDGEERDLLFRLREAWLELAADTPGDEAFARAWIARVERTSFEKINGLVGQHNQFYPVERRLPWDFRLADYRAPWGIEWRRERRGPAWVLETLPADRGAAIRATVDDVSRTG